ncbi:MAG: ribbon-helix-helix domain-containing protein [archaeon]
MAKQRISKEKISITIDKDLLRVIESMVDSKKFRNRSHVFEYSLSKFLEEVNRE